MNTFQAKRISGKGLVQEKSKEKLWREQTGKMADFLGDRESLMPSGAKRKRSGKKAAAAAVPVPTEESDGKSKRGNSLFCCVVYSCSSSVVRSLVF